MSSLTNLALVFKKAPAGVPIPQEDLITEDIGNSTSLPVPTEGVSLEHLYASFDPYLRELMLAPDDDEPLFAAFQLGKPIWATSIARILASNREDLKEGDVVLGMLPVQEYSIFFPKDEERFGPLTKLDLRNGPSDIRDYLGVLGMTGLTAYSSFYEIGKPKRGETIFISSAAGAIGQVVGQLARHEGLTVIGSVGSESKADFLIQELGFDGAFNYKSEKPGEALARLAPNGIDIYFENVGGEQLEAALEKMNNGGRIVGCGMVSQYNNETPYLVKNLYQIILKRLTFRGFLVNDEDFAGPWKERHQEHVADLLKRGKLRATTTEVLGMRNAAEGFVGMFQGKSLGKVVLRIKV